MQEPGSELRAKKTKSAGKRIRDIKRLLENEKFQISAEKRLEMEEEIKRLQGVISRNKSSYKKKLDRYLQYKKNKQKTIRFVELVKVKRKINQLQKQLVEALKNGQGDDAEQRTSEKSLEDQAFRIRSELETYRRYEDYIRLLPFFKERKYIPLFSNTDLDAETLDKRRQYIDDVQELKEELRMRKVKASKERDLSVKDSFLLHEENSREHAESLRETPNKPPIKKIEYSIGGNQDKKNRRQNPPQKTKKNSNKKTPEKHDKAELSSASYSKSKSKVPPPPDNHHIIFSDSD